MTRDHAIAAIRELMLGLPREDTLDARVARLMERVASHAHAEVLRDALTEHGARALIEDNDNTGATVGGAGQAIASSGRG